MTRQRPRGPQICGKWKFFRRGERERISAPEAYRENGTGCAVACAFMIAVDGVGRVLEALGGNNGVCLAGICLASLDGRAFLRYRT